ncbi:MAG: YARHG domain-containing protein [Deltaproteobacteria bacterium]|nr:YARHG domain-containing protein [Deltaproteobacteria bacterium]
MTKISTILFFCLLILWTSYSTNAEEQHKSSTAIAFLRDGQIWIAEHNGQNERLFITTTGKVKDYLFSPDLKYLAYHGTMKGEVGMFEILDIESGKLIHEKKFNLKKKAVHFNRWMSKIKLLFRWVTLETELGPMGMSYEYDIEAGKADEINWDTDIIDYDTENTLKVYHDTVKDDQNRRMVGFDQLHLFDLKSKTNKIIYTIDRKGFRRGNEVRLTKPIISNTKQYIAFMRDYKELLVYNMSNEVTKKISDAYVLSRNFWSPNDVYIQSYSKRKPVVINVQNPTNIIFLPRDGKKFIWESDEHLLYEKNENTYRYSLRSEKDKLIIKKALQPTYLFNYLDNKKMNNVEPYNYLEKMILSDIKLKESNLLHIDNKRLWLLRNSIFARHGRTFNNDDLNTWFKAKTWYKVNPNYSDTLLTDNDKSNVSTILLEESQR